MHIYAMFQPTSEMEQFFLNITLACMPEVYIDSRKCVLKPELVGFLGVPKMGLF